MSLSESNVINGFKIFTVYHPTFVFTGMILFVLSEALTVSYAFLNFFFFGKVCVSFLLSGMM